MKKSSLKLSTIALVLILVMTLLVLPSCKSVEAVTSDAHNSSLITHSSHHDTVVLRDSVYRHDSIIYRERTVHDTVYITKEVYKDTHNSSLIARNSTKSDTIHDTQYIERVVEHPPERYVPKFYRWCTIALWAIIALAIGYGVIRWKMT